MPPPRKSRSSKKTNTRRIPGSFASLVCPKIYLVNAGGRANLIPGNLPYSADKDSLTKHFEKIAPVSVRVATQIDKPTKCRGFGFIEFDNYDRMKTCLKLYHHSMFDDKKYPPRRINVELT